MVGETNRPRDSNEHEKLKIHKEMKHVGAMPWGKAQGGGGNSGHVKVVAL